MSGANGDLFGKIDALLVKHDPDALIDRGLEHEDFPVLDEVIAVAAEEPANPNGRAMARRHCEPAQMEPSAREQDANAARSAVTVAQAAVLDDAQVSSLLAGLEERLVVLFERQQQRTEAMMRRIVREELDL